MKRLKELERENMHLKRLGADKELENLARAWRIDWRSSSRWRSQLIGVLGPPGLRRVAPAFI